MARCADSRRDADTEGRRPEGAGARPKLGRGVRQVKGQTNRHRVAAVLRHVDFVVAYWPDLLEARIPGTRRRWAQTRTRAESRQHASMHHDEVAALTRAPAPVHLDVLDTIVDVVKISHTLADAVAQLAGVDRLPPPSSAYADPRPYLDLVKRHFDAAA